MREHTVCSEQALSCVRYVGPQANLYTSFCHGFNAPHRWPILPPNQHADARPSGSHADNTCTPDHIAPLPLAPCDITRLTLVPLLNSLATIPPLCETELTQTQIQGLMEKDEPCESSFRSMKERMTDEIRDAFGGPGSLTATTGPFGTAVGWWEKPGTGNWNRWRPSCEGFEIRYPKTKRERECKVANAGGHKGVSRRQGLKLPRAIDPEDADCPELLVPIRIEFDVEHHKMRDTFIWNLNDPIVTPEIFAQSFVEDFSLAPTYHSTIVKSIQDQLNDYKAHQLSFDPHSGSVVNIQGETSCGKLGERDSEWWHGWRRKVKGEIAPGGGGDGMGDHNQDHEDYRSMGVDEFMIDESTMQEDMRILIKLDIIVATTKLDDQFEWDLNNPSASPEDFAEVCTQELGLGGEFKTAIAHSIREQVQTYQKSLFLVGDPSDGSPVQPDDLKQSFLPTLTSGARPAGEVEMFTPLLNYPSKGELEQMENGSYKDLAKRRKRNMRRRRGVALPDREPLRTYRTPVVGFPELNAANPALAAAADAPVSRRAAAAAASLTIANIIASENGTAFMPTRIMPTTWKEKKKPMRPFKAPVYPAGMLRSTSVVAPTPSMTSGPFSLPPLRYGEAHRSSSSPAPTYISPRLPHLSGSTSIVSGARAGVGSSSYLSSKVISAKRVKELEREAKEQEWVEGQHPNFVEGVWHCSNCGCPEAIAIGRRKGPLGGGTQCGTCGKYWSWNRRPRPVEYNIDPNFHSECKLKETESKVPSSKKKGGGAAVNSVTPSEAPTPPGMGIQGGGGDDAEVGGATMVSHEMEDNNRALSPLSTSSSDSEASWAQTMKMNGHVENRSGCVSVIPLFPPKSEKRRRKDREKDRVREKEKEKGKCGEDERDRGDACKSAPAASAGSAGVAPTATTHMSSLGAPPFSSLTTIGEPNLTREAEELIVALCNAPPECRKEHGDWYAVYNPLVKKALDLNLVNTFPHTTVVCCVQFSADGRLLATGCDRTTQIYDVRTGAKVVVFVDDNAPKGGDLYIRSVRFSPDGKLLATGAEDHKIRVWDIAKGLLRYIFDGHQSVIYSLDFSRDGRYIVSGSGDETVRIWDMAVQSCRVITNKDKDSLDRDARVTSVAISPDGTMVASGSLDRVVRIWNLATGTLLERLRGHSDSVYSVAFTPDGKGIVSGSLDKSLKFWDITSLVNTFSRNGSTGHKDQDPMVTNTPTSTAILSFLGHKDFVLSASVSTDSRWVISGSKDRTVHFWDARTSELQFMLQGHKNSVISLDINPLGGMFATGSGDHTTRIWTYSAI